MQVNGQSDNKAALFKVKEQLILIWYVLGGPKSQSGSVEQKEDDPWR
jgi:hypothetical protein